MTATVLDKRFVLGEKIGAGSFGEICRAVDMDTGEAVAAKLERKDSKKPQLAFEYMVYDSIKKGTGFPSVRYFGATEQHRVMIMDLLGQSLEGLFNLCSRRFTLKTISMLAIQLIDRLEQLHANCYIHRDLKPDNFLIGGGRHDRHVVYMVDLGLSKLFRDRKTHHHISYGIGRKLVGTPRYSSIHTHNGEEQSRRDDLLSLGYMLVYFKEGKLPWQGLRCTSKQEKYDMIGKKKRETSIESLCKNCPTEFAQYMKYCSRLQFEEEPNYLHLKNLFCRVLQSTGQNCDWIFDWDDLNMHKQFIQQMEAPQLAQVFPPSYPAAHQHLNHINGYPLQRICSGQPEVLRAASKSQRFPTTNCGVLDLVQSSAADLEANCLSEQVASSLKYYLQQLEAKQPTPSQAQSAQVIAKLESERDEFKLQCEEFKALNQRLHEENFMLKTQLLAYQSYLLKRTRLPGQCLGAASPQLQLRQHYPMEVNTNSQQYPCPPETIPSARSKEYLNGLKTSSAEVDAHKLSEQKRVQTRKRKSDDPIERSIASKRQMIFDF